jgi:tetratricopeptide (TPR) repeat protein
MRVTCRLHRGGHLATFTAFSQMLTVSQVSKAFGGRTLFEDVSLQVNRGDRLGLVGPNGAGKSTLFSLILGEASPDDGRIAVERQAKLGFLPLDQDEKALADFEAALKLDPKDAGALLGRAELHRVKKELVPAIADYNLALEAAPNDLRALLGRAAAYYSSGDVEKALKDYAAVTDNYKDFAQGWNDHAWLLATGPRDSLRDGAKAVEFSLRACELTEWKQGGFLDTLAAAYAEKGEFDDAVKWQGEAIAHSQDETESVRVEMKARLELYREKKPFHEEPK